MLDELGEHGRLLRLQLNELSSGVFEDRRLVVADYVGPGTGDAVEDALDRLAAIPADDLLSLEHVVRAFRPDVRSPSTSTPRSSRAATGCCGACPRCPGPRSSGSSCTSATSTASSARRPTSSARPRRSSDEQARLVKSRLTRVAEAGALERFG